jgi:hypothetical protein
VVDLMAETFDASATAKQRFIPGGTLCETMKAASLFDNL